MVAFSNPTMNRISSLDAWLDESMLYQYKTNALAQRWGRIAKVAEECGEVIAAFIGATGQNPRKGYTHNDADVLAELADVVLTAACAIQSITKDARKTDRIIEDRIIFVFNRAFEKGE